MKRRIGFGGLIVAFLGLSVAHAQGPANAMPGPGSPPYQTPGDGAPAVPSSGNGQPAAGEGPPVFGPGISSWIAYPRCGNCCGPVGGNGPIFMETYGRTGFSFPMGNGIIGREYNPGYWMQAGGRSLFFNPSIDAAWTIDLGLSTVWYNGPNPRPVTLHNAIQAVTRDQGGNVTQVQNAPTAVVFPGSLNQSFLDVALGREIYLLGTGGCTPGTCCDRCGETRWRVGADLGGRWGTSRMGLHDILGLPAGTQAAKGHLTATVGGIFVALHTDLEIPTGCCLFFVGLRTEYGWAFNDILQSANDTNVQAINLLLNFGLKF